MKMKFKLAQKGLTLVFVFLLFELAFLATLSLLVENARIEESKQARSKELAGRICHVFRTVNETVDEIQAIQDRGVDEEAIALFQKRTRVLKDELNELLKSAHRYPRYQKKVKEVVIMVQKALRVAEILIGLDKNYDLGQRLVVASKFKKTDLEKDLLQKVSDLLETHRTDLTKGVDIQAKQRQQIELLLAIMVLLNIASAVGLGAVFLNSIANRIAILTDNSKRFAEGMPFNKPIKSNDELQILDESIRRMASELTEAQRKEQAIIENANTVICSLNKDSSFIKVNPACKKIWGRDEAELSNKALSEFVIANARNEFNNDISACVAGTKQEFETIVLKPDGTEVAMLGSAQWQSEEDSLYCVFHDITERKRAEDQLKASEKRIHALLDNMLVGLLISTPEGTIDSSNGRLEAICKFNTNELQGKPIGVLFKQKKSLTPTKPGSSVELEIRNKENEEIPVEIAVTEFKSTDGPRLLTNVVDISERRAIERAKQEFLAMVSHDLRTPLSSVSAYLELLAAGLYGKLSPEDAAGAEEASQQAFKLLALISDLLEMTRMETSKIELKIKSESLEELVESVMSMSDDLADEKGVKLVYDLEDADFQADFNRLKRVISDLIKNAIHASAEGETVIVKTINHGSSVEASVTDRGVTIDESECEAIFDRLNRNKSERLKQRQGSGLGLPICKAIIEQHGGSIGVDSSAEDGTRFWFKMDKKRSEDT